MYYETATAVAGTKMADSGRDNISNDGENNAKIMPAFHSRRISILLSSKPSIVIHLDHQFDFRSVWFFKDDVIWP